MAWRLVRSLETLRAQVRKAAPRAVPPATSVLAWGTVGDLAHQSGTSDHNPVVYSALGATPVVCACDFPHAPALGLNGSTFTEALRVSRDSRIGYVIFNGRIFSGHAVDGTPAFIWRTYTGSDQHRDHWHVSSVHTVVADDIRTWAMPGIASGEATMSVLTGDEQRRLKNVDEYAYGIAKELDPLPNITGGAGVITPVPNLPLQRIKALVDKVDQLVARPTAGNVTPTPEQWAALTNDLRTLLETLFAEKVGQAAEAGAEAAIRKVLGGLDGAVPPIL